MNAQTHILAIDQGTTSSRAVVFDHLWRIIGLGQREHPQIYPRSGWVEHDAAQIWATQAATIGDALAQACIGAHELTTIGITNQRETTLLWDRRSGQPLGPAIVWQDRRTAQRCAALLAAGHGPLIRDQARMAAGAYSRCPRAPRAASWRSAPSTAG